MNTQIFSAAVLAVAVTLSACGGGSDETGTGETSGATPTAPAEALTRSDVEGCLASAGLDTAPGPLIAGSKTIGVKLPGGGGIKPGNFSAALFVSDSTADAKQEATSFESTFGSAIEQRGNVVILYDPSGNVPAATRSKIASCTGSGSSP